MLLFKCLQGTCCKIFLLLDRMMSGADSKMKLLEESVALESVSGKEYDVSNSGIVKDNTHQQHEKLALHMQIAAVILCGCCTSPSRQMYMHNRL